MANEQATVRRIVHVAFTVPGGNPEHLHALMQMAMPFFQAFGGLRMQLLHNADDPARFMQVIEYDAPTEIEVNRQKFAADPRVQAYLQAVRTLAPGAVEVNVYREIGA
jgi:hypothetical protein